MSDSQESGAGGNVPPPQANAASANVPPPMENAADGNVPPPQANAANGNVTSQQVGASGNVTSSQQVGASGNVTSSQQVGASGSAPTPQQNIDWEAYRENIWHRCDTCGEEFLRSVILTCANCRLPGHSGRNCPEVLAWYKAHNKDPHRYLPPSDDDSD